MYRQLMLQNELKSDVARFTAHGSNLSCSNSGCCRVGSTGFANFIDEWSQCDFYFTNLGVILEYLESSIRLSSTWSWNVYTIVRDTRSSGGGPLTWKAQIH